MGLKVLIFESLYCTGKIGSKNRAVNSFTGQSFLFFRESKMPQIKVEMLSAKDSFNVPLIYSFFEIISGFCGSVTLSKQLKSWNHTA